MGDELFNYKKGDDLCGGECGVPSTFSPSRLKRFHTCLECVLPLDNSSSIPLQGLPLAKGNCLLCLRLPLAGSLPPRTGQQEDTKAQSPGLSLDNSIGLSQLQWSLWNQLGRTVVSEFIFSFSPST